MQQADNFVLIGALVGISIAPRRYNIVKALPVVQGIPAKVSQRIVIKMPDENTPLIIQRRIRRNRSRETVLNWKIFCLLMILVLGVFIGIHLLVNDCKIPVYFRFAFVNFISSMIDKTWPVNFPFHLIDRSVWYHDDPFANSTLLNTSSVSNIVLSHTKSDFCHNYITCVDVISKMQVSSDYILQKTIMKKQIDYRIKVCLIFHSTSSSVAMEKLMN